MQHLQAISDAIALIIPGQIEVVVHHLESQKIAHISGNFTNREVGDDSLIDTNELRREAVDSDGIGPYAKTNADGEVVKSISAILRDANGQPEYLLCINLKTAVMNQAVDALLALVNVEQQVKPEALLSGDWREQVNEVIARTVADLGVPLIAVKKNHRQHIVQALEGAGLFQYRGSPEYIAKALGCSRATLYNMLKTEEH